MTKLVDWVKAHGKVIAYAGAALLLLIIVTLAPRWVLGGLAMAGVVYHLQHRAPKKPQGGK